MPSSPKMNWPFPSENEAPWYEAFEDMVRSQDAAGFASREDRNLVITGGAYIGWDLGTSTLSWSEPILVSSPVTGVTVSIPASSFVLARGDMVFVNLVRAPVQPATHVPEVAQQLPALVDSVYLIAVRIVDEVHFRNDQRLKDGDILPGLGFGVSLGLGNVVGPASATDSAFVLYDLGATLIKDSVVIATGAGVLTTPGTVDGRNVPTDGAKLDLIEPLADVTDAVNVAAAGSLMADGSEDLTSNLTVAAAEEIDGREISTDGAKLDLIEPLADVTDDVNVEAAGALMRDGGNLTGPVTAVALVTVDGRDISEDGDKLDDLTFTGSKNLDTMALDVAANTLKDTNATHSVDMVGATALAIQPNVVTLAKMAQVATATLLGRETAATGDVEALTPAEAAAVLNIEVGAQTNQQVGFGEWTHGNNSLGATTTGTFDVNNATVLAVTVIRFPVFPIAPGISLVRGLTDLSGPGFLQLQDNTDPLGTQVTFLVSSVTNIVDLWVDFTGVVLQNQGTNWGANPYTFNWTPQVDASSHVRRDVSNTADGVSLYFQGSDPIGAPTATKGHIWNLAEAPNELFFSDDDGRNQNVSWWMNNLASHVGHYGIWLNLEQKTSPFEQYPTGDLSIEYNDNADKFYCTYVDGSNDVNAYDSDDGITWSAKKEVDPGTTIGDVSQAASDGIHFGIGADNTFYRSTDLTVANTVAYGTFANITGGCTGLIYDHTLGLWVACGDNGVTGYIETSPTGSTWTLRRTLVATHLPKAMDWDPVGGRAVVVCGSTSLNTYWSDNKTTWTQDTSNNPSIGLGNIWWSKQHGCFFGGDSSQNMHMSTSNTGGTWSTISGMDASHVWRSDDFMCFTGGGALATIYQMGAKGTLVANSTMTKTLSGYIDDYNFQPILNTATQRARIRGGKGVIAWPSYSNNKLMYARYAPPPLT
jgi:hypothetical protein